MASRDLLDQIHTTPLFFPVVANAGATPVVSQIIDTAGYEGVSFLMIVGAAGTTAVATITLEHGDQPNLSDTSTPAAQDIVGSLALAGFVTATPNVTRKFGYCGAKRYLRVTSTPTGNSSAIFFAGVALLGYGRNNPQTNPPQ